MKYTIVIVSPRRIAIAYDEHNRIAGKVIINPDGKTYYVESDVDDLPLKEMLDQLEFGK